MKFSNMNARLKSHMKGLAIMLLGATCGFTILASLPSGISLVSYSEELNNSGYRLQSRYTEDGVRIPAKGKAYIMQIHGGMSIATSQSFTSQVQYLLPRLRPEDLIILHVESSGGDAVSCMNIGQEVQNLKPYIDKVLSVTDFKSLSCGYYVSATADKIFASNGALMGNVGVVVKLPSERGMIKVRGTETIGSTRLKELYAGDAIRNDADRELIENSIYQTYIQFSAHIMKNRFFRTSEELISGDMFQGRHAIKTGAIDEVKSVRQVLLGLHADNYDLLIVNSYDSAVNQLMSGFGAHSSLDADEETMSAIQLK